MPTMTDPIERAREKIEEAKVRHYRAALFVGDVITGFEALDIQYAEALAVVEAAKNDRERAVNRCGGNGRGCLSNRPLYFHGKVGPWKNCLDCPMFAMRETLDALMAKGLS